uniref:RNA polymerase sigma factor n=1 Tax=Anaerobutyricum hallii TaxID=39488 RepID=UPI00266BADC4
MYCRSCRKWFPNNILFCDICGKPLVKDLDIYGENFFNGDVQAFDYIYQNSYNWVAGEVRKMFSANSSEVEDCVQEIYLLLYRKIKYYDPRQGSFSAWFNALVRNRIYDYGRKLAGNREILPETSQQYFKEITDRNVYINPEARIEHAEREQILDEILDNIGEGQRICIQMYYNDGLKIKEIAQILNISEGTVKSRIHNGLKKLNTKVDEMQKRGLYTFRMLPLGFLLWLLSRDDCSAKEDYRALYHARTLAGQNVLQNAPMAAGNKAAGIKMAGRNQNVVKHASMQQAGQAGAKHAAINHAARAASRAGGKAIKAGMVKALAGGITAAVIGSGVFIGGKALKQHQGDKKVITSGQEYSTQEEKEGTPDSSVKEFVDDNQAFIKEILALEAEVPEGTEFQTDINENVRSVVYTSLGLLCDNKSFGEE